MTNKLEGGGSPFMGQDFQPSVPDVINDDDMAKVANEAVEFVYGKREGQTGPLSLEMGFRAEKVANWLRTQHPLTGGIIAETWSREGRSEMIRAIVSRLLTPPLRPSSLNIPDEEANKE